MTRHRDDTCRKCQCMIISTQGMHCDVLMMSVIVAIDYNLIRRHGPAVTVDVDVVELHPVEHGTLAV